MGDFCAFSSLSTKVLMVNNLVDCENPRIYGKALTGNLGRYWRYRVADFRLLAEIRDSELIIIAVGIGHRSKIYR